MILYFLKQFGEEEPCKIYQTIKINNTVARTMLIMTI